jgi:hypothetical protein
VAAPALETLRSQRLGEIRALLSLRPKRQLLRRQRNNIADAVNRACVVVLVAHLEGFVEDLVGDVIDELDKLGPATVDVPTILLAAHVIGEVELIAEMTDRERRARKIEELFRTHSGMWLDTRLARGRLRATPIAADLSNPGGKEIARVLGLLGMRDVFASMVLPDGADPEKRMNELVGIRNSIAHGGGGPAIGDDQTDEYVRSVEAVGEGLERAAASHVQTICRSPSLPWS